MAERLSVCMVSNVLQIASVRAQRAQEMLDSWEHRSEFLREQVLSKLLSLSAPLQVTPLMCTTCTFECPLTRTGPAVSVRYTALPTGSPCRGAVTEERASILEVSTEAAAGGGGQGSPHRPRRMCRSVQPSGATLQTPQAVRQYQRPLPNGALVISPEQRS